MSLAIVPLSKAKQNLLRLVRAVDEGGQRFLLVRDGVPVSVLMPVDEYEAWAETLDILDDPETMKSLKRGLADAKAGRLFRLSPDGKFERVPKRDRRRPRK